MADAARTAAPGLTAAEAGPPLVFVPAVSPGAGLGHLARCLSLRDEAGERGFLALDNRWYDARPELRALASSVPRERLLFGLDRLPGGAVVVFDSRKTEPAALSDIARRALTVGLDEGGPCRDRFHILFDTLPMILSRHAPNARPFPFRPPAGGSRPPRFPFGRFLISFGGEDRAGLTAALLRALLVLVPAEAVTVVEGPLFARRAWPGGVTVVQGSRHLSALIDEHDLVFTHYGLTAYESLSRGVPVVLFNPGPYHRRLSRADGLPDIGIKKVDAARLGRLLENPAEHERALGAFRARMENRVPLPDAIGSLRPSGAAVCPVCGSPGGRIIERFALKTHIRCPRCRTIRLIYWGQPKRYEERYFSEEYRAQYGRTYLEDFGHIKEMGFARLGLIEKCRRSSPSSTGAPSLLDVGAAFGPFLAAAREHGYEAEGLECSPEAAAHVRDRLGIPCRAGDFLSSEFGVRLGEKSYDIITMWYVIEHFVQTGDALGRVNRMLKPGGLFALAAPSGGGISFRKDRRRFLEKSPDDHFTVWTPSAARRSLARYGFKTMRTVITGHHPERFFRRPRGRILSAAALFASRLFDLGDTFEIYAVKTKDLP